MAKSDLVLTKIPYKYDQLGFPFYPVGDSRPTRPCLLHFFLERKTGITGVPFGRTDLSIGGIGTSLHALLHRHGPVGPSFQGMPEEFDFHNLFLRAESDTK